MLFSYNRVLLAVITAFAFLQLTFAIPVPNLKAHPSSVFNDEIAKMEVSGRDAIEMKNWHENHVKHEMRTNPNLKGLAHSALFHHSAHEGGSDPNEPNHITATFYDKHGDPIHNHFNGGLNHHVYVPANNPGLSKENKKALKRANVALRQRTHN